MLDKTVDVAAREVRCHSSGSTKDNKAIMRYARHFGCFYRNRKDVRMRNDTSRTGDAEMI